MDWITPQIAVGNVDDALTLRHGATAEVQSVLCLSGFPTLSYVPDLRWTAVTMIDGHGNDHALFLRALDAIHTAVEAGHRILVHCMEGRSRSVLVVSLYLALIRGLPLDEAISLVAERRTLAAVDRSLLGSLPEAWRQSPATAIPRHRAALTSDTG
jgi:histidinol-phosphate aminotransferase